MECWAWFVLSRRGILVKVELPGFVVGGIPWDVALVDIPTLHLLLLLLLCSHVHVVIVRVPLAIEASFMGGLVGGVLGLTIPLLHLLNLPYVDLH